MFGFLDKIKEKSEALLEVYARDIKEFASTVTEESKPLAKLLLPTIPQDEDEITIDGGNAGAVTESLEDKEIALRSNSKTFLDPISAEEEASAEQVLDLPKEKSAFEPWSNEFDLKQKTEEISSLLEKDEKLKALHAEVVPVQVSYETFWQRYFYRLEILKKEEEKKKKIQTLTTGASEELENWDDDEEEEPKKPNQQPKASRAAKHIEELRKEISLLKQVKAQVEGATTPTEGGEASTATPKSLSELVDYYHSKLKQKDEEIASLQKQSQEHQSMKEAIMKLLQEKPESAETHFKELCPFLFASAAPASPPTTEATAQHTEEGLATIKEPAEGAEAKREGDWEEWE